MTLVAVEARRALGAVITTLAGRFFGPRAEANDKDDIASVRCPRASRRHRAASAHHSSPRRRATGAVASSHAGVEFAYWRGRAAPTPAPLLGERRAPARGARRRARRRHVVEELAQLIGRHRPGRVGAAVRRLQRRSGDGLRSPASATVTAASRNRLHCVSARADPPRGRLVIGLHAPYPARANRAPLPPRLVARRCARACARARHHAVVLLLPRTLASA